MALLVGTTPETRSRSLGQMARRGVIEFESGRITVRDRAALETLAS
jgi:predicted transcriptional regulator